MPYMISDVRKPVIPAPAGIWQAVCCDFIPLGKVLTKNGPKTMGRLVWQLDERTAGLHPETGKRWMVNQRYNLTLNEKSNLRLCLESWRNKKFTPEELQAFDIEKVLSANCQVQVVHNLDAKKTVWANVTIVISLGVGMVPIRVSPDYVRWQDRPENRGKAAEILAAEAAAEEEGATDEEGVDAGTDPGSAVPF